MPFARPNAQVTLQSRMIKKSFLVYMSTKAIIALPPGPYALTDI